MRKSILKISTDKDKNNIKHLKSKDLTNRKLLLLGGTKGEDVHLKKIKKDDTNKNYYT
ncbi:MAG: hypothetical protein WCG23_02110 [bacterium]